MDKRARTVMYVQPTFDSVERQYQDEIIGDPRPGLARQASEFILSPFYTRSFEDVMGKPTSQQELAGGLAPIPTPVLTPGPNEPDEPSGPVRLRRLRRSDSPDILGGDSSQGGGCPRHLREVAVPPLKVVEGVVVVEQDRALLHQIGIGHPQQMSIWLVVDPQMAAVPQVREESLHP